MARQFLVRSRNAEEQRLCQLLESASALKNEGNTANALNVFVDSFIVVNGFSAIQLGLDATRVATEPNAGGKSVVSEAMSVEYMVMRFRARDVQTEMEVRYWSEHWKKVDYIITVGTERAGVSVTRAMGFRTAASFTFEDAQRLLKKKLFGLVVARAGVQEGSAFSVAILHIWCQSKRIAFFLKPAFAQLVGEETARFKREGGDAGGAWSPCTSNVICLLTIAANAPQIFTDEISWIT